MDSASVDFPFRGLTLEDRHPNDPLLPLSEKERRIFCPTCMVPEINRTVHRRGRLHQPKLEAARTAHAYSTDVAVALTVLRRHRSDLLRDAPSVSATSSEDVVIDMPDLELL